MCKQSAVFAKNEKNDLPEGIDIDETLIKERIINIGAHVEGVNVSILSEIVLVIVYTKNEWGNS